MSKLDILVVTAADLTRTIRTGFSNRVLELSKALLSNQAHVTVFHTGDDQCINNLRMYSYGSRKARFLKGRFLDAASTYTSPLSNSLVKNVADFIKVEKVDVIQIEAPYPFPMTYLAKRLCDSKTRHGKNIAISLDEHNVEFLMIASKMKRSGILAKMVASGTLLYVFPLEDFALKRADIVLSVSAQNASQLKRVFSVSEQKISVVPNGVNIEPYVRGQRNRRKAFLDHDRKVVFFHGTLSWYPNLEAANLIVTYIAPRITDAMFVICGADAPRSLVNRIDGSINVKYLGYVREIADYIIESDLCIAPILKGGGTRLKILEYAAAGKPIVATYKAIEGLEMLNNVHGLFSKDVNVEFISNIKRVFKHDRLAEGLGRNAGKLARRYDWSAIGERLCKDYSKLVKRYECSA